METVEQDRCSEREWCDQPEGVPHRHQLCYGTWLGFAATGDNRGTGVQLVVGEFDGQPLPVIVVLDSALPGRQWDVVLSWERFGALMDAGAQAWSRFRPERMGT